MHIHEFLQHAEKYALKRILLQSALQQMHKDQCHVKLKRIYPQYRQTNENNTKFAH